MFPYKNQVKKVLENEEWIKVLAKLMKEKGLTENELKMFTVLCVVAYYYGNGDALAGVMLIGTVRRKEWKELFKKVFGRLPSTHVELFIMLHSVGYTRIIGRILR